MQLNTSVESVIMELYLAYWESYITGDVDKLAYFLDDSYTQVGSAETEVFFNKTEAVKFIESTIHQVAGKVDMRNRNISLDQLDGLILISEQTDLYFEQDGTWAFYAKFRASSLLQQKEGVWKIVHQHSSMPDLRAEAGENIAIEKVTKENLELRDAIRRGTVELEHKNRELEMESSLERVRTVAMGMRNGDDLMDICEVLFTELEKLGFDGLRNAMINIYDDGREVFLNYDYAPGPGKTVTPFAYNIHPVIQRQVSQLRSSKNAVSEIVISGNELAEFRSMRVTNGEADDPRFDIFTAINYYFYSTGLGAIGISTFNTINAEHRNVLQRFRNVFDLAYQRYMDISHAEEQARESLVQLALERVRARTMAMQQSEELPDAANTLFLQVQALGIPAWSAGYGIWDEDKKAAEACMSSEGVIQKPFKIPITGDPSFVNFYDAYRRGDTFYVEEIGGEALVSHYRFMRTLPVVGEVLDGIISAGFPLPTFQIFHVAFFSQGYLLFITYEKVPDAHDIFKRFTTVFEQTYTRFLDLQKAEVQAREAQVELALERVRARTMAMHNSSELIKTAEVLFDQLKELGAESQGVAFAICEKDNIMVQKWTSIGVFSVPYTFEAGEQRMYEAWKNQAEIYEEVYEGDRIRKYYELFMEIPEFKQGIQHFIESGTPLPDWQKNHAVPFKYGYLLFITTKPFEGTHIFSRFAKVFEQTYTRFLDLQKAEAQTRDAQIEAALERVRSRTMGMQKSEELKDVIKIIYQQLSHLKINCDHAGFVIDYTPGGDWHFWIADEQDIPAKITHPYFDSVWANQFNEAKTTGANLFATYLNFEEKNKFYTELLSYVPGLPESTKEFYLSCPGLAVSTVLLDTVGLYIENFSAIPYTSEENNILLRFGNVFQQTYTRFLDLKKAEAQAKEAQIEAALEKVRARTMAMQHSDELLDVASILFQQVKALGVPQWNCGFNIWEIGDEEFIYYPGTPDGIISQSPCKIPLTEHPVFKSFDESRKRGDELFVYEKEGDFQNGHYQYMLSLPGVGDLLQSMLNAGFEFPAFQIDHVANFAYGNLIFITYQHFPEMHDIFKRFAKVFEQTYTRFLDLQRAEAQALEAIKRASVDRVRAEIASMRTTRDLDRITPLIWNELTTIGVQFIRCGVFIMDEEQQRVHTYLSNPEGEAIAAFHQPYNIPGEISEVVSSWRKKEMYAQHWDEARFNEFTNNLVQQGAITTGEKYLTENRPTDLYLHFLPFLQGMLYVGNSEALSENELQLVQNLADAFSTAYSRYEDFNKLEAAKQQVDKTLADLKQAQSQLVQAEKMASLGELTAGIAHEIQNPLNFVNNFSELNAELIGEMELEISAGNIDEVKSIANDIRENELKINHHGKRADAIVKGMLQHSRNTAGEKIITDINALADEYLRLAYHGFRSKDKDCNISLHTELDISLPKIAVIPQDIGRVFLNLFNNAFYAVAQRKRQVGDNFEPTVLVSTRMSGDKLVILVKDNGNGIPGKVLDKIFQPFFTTKPTGQGTGLGLSLSYDIIKAHGGTLQVVANEGEDTQFIILLDS